MRLNISQFYNKHRWIILIFVLAIIFRFIHFGQSVYFGYDEARDAYVSQDIYLKGDFKIIGPGAGPTGVHHGVLFWYILGPLYLIGLGEPLIVSSFFRIFNALGVFLIFQIGSLFFNKRVGLVAALIYAVSYEVIQYAIYAGNPSLAIISWLFIFYGLGLIYKDSQNSFKGLLITVVGVATAIQFELYLVYTVFLTTGLLFILHKKLRLNLQQIFILVTVFIAILSPYILSQILYNFQDVKQALQIIGSGFSVLAEGETKYSTYLKGLSTIFQDNVMLFPVRSFWSYVLMVVIIGSLMIQSWRQKSISLLIVIVWCLSGMIMLVFGGYSMYHVNVGIGLGVIIGVSYLVALVSKRFIYLGLILLSAVLMSNIYLVWTKNDESINVGIKAQPFMRLVDQYKIIDQMYRYANGNGFTFKVTGMPYRVQTVWAYLFQQHGLKQYGYLPFLETGNAADYWGYLPAPKNGVSCIRFYIKEPDRGIPKNLFETDENEENYFSKIKVVENIGYFELQYRQAIGECHNDRP